MYHTGQGVLQDYKTAVKWYRLAAEQKHNQAQANMGLMYVNGKGVPQDFTRAHMWWTIAGSIKNRDAVGKQMTQSQLKKAQDLARECVRKKYKGC